MKHFFRNLFVTFFSAILIVGLIPLNSFAETSTEGDTEETVIVDPTSYTQPYSINDFSDYEWLIYVVNSDTNTIVSDVYTVYYSQTVHTKIKNASLGNYSKETLYNKSGGVNNVTFTIDMWNSNIGVGSFPTPADSNGNTNAPAVKSYISTNIKDIATWLMNHNSLLSNMENEKEKYYLCYEPVWVIPIYHPNGTRDDREHMSGTYHSLCAHICDEILTNPYYTTGGSPNSYDVMSDTGWWWQRKFTNHNMGTIICTESTHQDALEKIGLTVQGENYAHSNTVIPFSTGRDKSIGLGIGVAWLGGDLSNPPSVVTPPTTNRITSTFTGHVDAKTYNRSDSYNLSNLNDPRGRIPSGEILTNGIEVDKWYCDYSVEKHEVTPQIANVYYTYKWDAYYGDIRDWHSATTDNPDSYSGKDSFSVTGTSIVKDSSKLICALPISPTHPSHSDSCYGTKTMYDVSWREMHEETRTGILKQIERKIYYYTLDTYDVETFAKGEITCENTDGISAYSGGTVIYSYNAGNSVQYGVNQNASVTNHVTHTPQAVYKTIKGADYNDCDRIANANLDSDADRFEAHNDLFYVKDGSTTHTFLSNATFRSGSEINPVPLGTYNFPDMTVASYPQLEKNVSIPFSCPNGFYYTSGTYTYNSIVNNTKATLIRRNAPETHSAYTASINDRIVSRFVQNEPVFVHTPVVSRIDTDGSAEVQLVASKQNSLMVDYQLRLDNMYSFQFDIEQHLNLLGYSLNGVAGSYSRYVSSTYGAEVRFPFDVAIVTNDGTGDKLTYYKENTWIKVDYDVETFYYIPSWAKEIDYGEIYFRVFAYNFDSLPDATRDLFYNNIDAQDQANNILADQNLPTQHYIAYTKIAVQTSGYIYGLEVVGCNDSVIFNPNESINPNNTFNNHIEQFAKNYCEYKSGTLNRLGGVAVKYTNTYDYLGTPIHAVTNSWNPKYTIPFANGSGVTNTVGTLGRGTKIGFTINTLSNLWNSEDKVVINPRYRYVTAGGTEYDYDDIIVYYCVGTSGEKHFIELDSARDVFENFSKTKLYDSYFVGTYTDKEIDDTAKIYSNIHNMNTSRWNVYGATQVLNTNGGDGVNCYSLGNIVLSEPLKTYTGNEEWLSYNCGNLVRLDANRLNSLVTSKDTIKDSVTDNLVANTDKELFEASMQKWYGEYYVPSDIHIVIKSDLDPYGGSFEDYVESKGGIGDDDDIFQDTGFLVLNFDITSIRKGEEDLTYYQNQNMLQVENNRSANHETVYAGASDTPITLRDGDIAIFDMLHDVKSYYSVGIGWTN